MPKFICCSSPFWGIVYPLLPIVRELVARGSEVIFYAPLEFRDAIQATGARFRPYLRGFASEIAPGPSHQFTPNRMINAWHFILKQIQQDAKDLHADCVLYETGEWCRFLPKAIDLPAVQINVVLPMNEVYHPFDPLVIGNKLDEAMFYRMKPDLDTFCRAFHLPVFDFTSLYFQTEQLNIVCMHREFHPAAASFDERFLFVGPCINPATRQQSETFPLDKLGQSPILYISLGTIHIIPAFYDICLTAFANTPQKVVISTGGRTNIEIFGLLPPNIIMHPNVPQLAILPQTEVFITHGGINSIMEALYYKVPMILVPQTLEQHLNANRIEELGLGLVIHDVTEVTAHRLRKAVEQLRNSPTIRANVQRMHDIVKKTRGHLQAADAIVQFLSR